MKRIRVEPKACKNCKLYMPRKRYPSGRLERPDTYRARDFCGRKCAGEFRRAEPRRECRHCGDRLRRKRYPSGQLERLYHFRTRSFCDARCRVLWVADHREEYSRQIGIASKRGWARTATARAHMRRGPVCYHGRPRGSGCGYCDEIKRFTGAGDAEIAKPREFWKRLTYQAKESE